MNRILLQHRINKLLFKRTFCCVVQLKNNNIYIYMFSVEHNTVSSGSCDRASLT